ncbi:GNAT family N-acetyltransferase [Candidatus Bathyarchaeota archaeon]|nr:MAG: GNAT family N-acetyltransferase [Candidatus Bathyarchaeota archaeon]
MGPWNVRKCHKEDLPKVLDLAERYTSFDAMPTMPDIELMYERNENNFFVAEGDRGNILGFATGYEKKGIPQEVLMSWKAKRVGYLDLMAVDVQHRKQGIGTALLNSVLDQFKVQGIDTIHLDVPSTEQDAIKLYHKLGFKTRAYSMVKQA